MIGVEEINEQIDWSKAPEWAKWHGLAGEMKSQVWFDDEKYSYVDGQQDGKAFFYCDACTYSSQDFSNVTFRPVAPAWSGEGLPPVGVRCEAAIPHTSGPNNERSFIWIEGSVIAYYEIKGKTYAWFSEDDGFYPPAVLEFRPIRTPEQIAKDERKKMADMLWQRYLQPILAPAQEAQVKTALGLIYDDFYRKP